MKRRNREKVADAIYKFVKKRFEKDPYVSVVVAAGGSSSWSWPPAALEMSRKERATLARGEVRADPL